MRKCIACVLLILSCFTLSGCDTLDTLSHWWTQVTTKVDVIANQASLKMKMSSPFLSEKTASLGYELEDALSKLEDVSTKSEEDYKKGFFASIVSGIKGEGLTAKERKDKADAEARQSVDRLTKLFNVSSDKDNKEGVKNQQKKEIFSNMKSIIIVVIVLAVIALLWSFLRKPKQKQLVATAKDEHKIGTIKVGPVTKVNVTNEKACRQMCKEYGLNYEEELAKCNGDSDELIGKLYRMGV